MVNKSSYKGGNHAVSHKDEVQTFYIHRNHSSLESSATCSSVRTSGNETKQATEPTDPKMQEFINKKALKPSIKFQNEDIIFSNGNNREKRRAELFQNYSAYTKFQLDNREQLFLKQEKELKEKLRLLDMPKNYHMDGSRPIANYRQIDHSIYEADSDLLETRDLELTRLKLMRRFDKNKVYSKYKTESFKIYKESAQIMDGHLERLKQFLIKQKTILTNLDKDLIDISSSRAERLYTGFEVKDNEELDTVLINSSAGADSTSAMPAKETKFIPSSIMSSLTPIITEKEFLAVVNDNLDILNPITDRLQQSRNGFVISNAGEQNNSVSDTDGGETSNQETAAPQYTATGRRRVGRPTNPQRTAATGPSSSAEPQTTKSTSNGVRMSRSDANNILNYHPDFAKLNPNYISNLISKHYTSPADIVTEEMEDEISIFKKINENDRAENGDRYYF